MKGTEFNRPFEERHKIFRIIEVVYRQKWTILLTFAVVFTLVAYYTLKQEKQYQSTASVIIQGDNIGKGFGIIDLSGSAARNLQNEVEILGSRDLQFRIAKKLLQRFYLDPATAKDTLLIVKSALNYVDTRDTANPFVMERMIKDLASSASFDLGRDKDVIKISMTSPSPLEAALLANTYAETYYEKDLTRSRSNASKVRNFLEQQSQQRLLELQKSEATLQAFMEDKGALKLNDKSTALIQKMTELESELENNDLEYQKSKLMLDNYKSELNRLVPQVTQKMINVDDLYIQELQKKVAQAEAERDVSKVVSSQDSQRPEYSRELAKRNNTIDSLRSVLAARTKDYVKESLSGYSISTGSKEGNGNIISSLTGQIQELQLKMNALKSGNSMISGTLKKYEGEFSTLPRQSVGLASLMRDKEFNEKLYLKIGEQYQEAMLAELSTFGHVEILNPAAVSYSPVSPRVASNMAVGALIGLIFGLFNAFTLNFFFNYVRSPQDVESLGFRLISTIPKISIASADRKALGSPQDENTPRLISSKTSYSTALESYQRLQLYLTYAFLNKDIKSLVVTSAGPGEGKSATAANLAITLANSGKKVLLVDTDMRKPAVHKYFNVHSSPSLLHHLFRKKSLDEVTKTTHVRGLHIITSIEFSQNPVLVLTSEAMQQFINNVGEIYDYVIFDTPPVNAVTDAIHLAQKVDEVILVARANKTNVEELNRASQLFEQFHVKIGGVVLNDFDNQKLYHYYGKYYGYYSEDNKGRWGKHKANKRNRIILKPENYVNASEFEDLIPDAGDLNSNAAENKSSDHKDNT